MLWATVKILRHVTLVNDLANLSFVMLSVGCVVSDVLISINVSCFLGLFHVVKTYILKHCNINAFLLFNVHCTNDVAKFGFRKTFYASCFPNKKMFWWLMLQCLKIENQCLNFYFNVPVTFWRYFNVFLSQISLSEGSWNIGTLQHSFSSQFHFSFLFLMCR